MPQRGPAQHAPSPITITIAKEAARTAFAQLSSDDQAALTSQQPYDAATCEVLRFAFAPDLNHQPKERRLRYDKVDHVIVHVRPYDPSIHLLGIAPRDRLSATSSQRVIEGEAVAELTFNVGVAGGRLALTGRAQDERQRRRTDIVTACINDVAQWVYYREITASRIEYPQTVMCVVPANVPETRRYLLAKVQMFAGKNRLLGYATAKIRIPA